MSGPILELPFEARHDKVRLGTLLADTLDALRSGAWLTLPELAQRIGHGSEAGISARLRELRKIGFRIDRRRRMTVAPERGLFEYRLGDGRFRML